MKVQKLNRTGRRPLGFVGEQIYDGNTRDHGSTRWDAVKVFKTETGAFVLGLANITCMDGEKDFFQVRKFVTADEVMTFIKKRVSKLEVPIKAALG